MSPSKAAMVSAAMLASGVSLAQDSGPQPVVVNSPQTYQLGHSPLNEPQSLARLPEAEPRHFTIPWGSGGFNVSAGLKGEYVDNVYLTEHQLKDDFIVIPKADLAGYFPVGQMNSLGFDVGLAYYQYLKNSSLNTGIPLINPNSDLRFNLKAGDFNFRFSERFSYQENPVYETGAEFFNVYNTALFKRYQNRVGGLAVWDQHDLVVTGGYFHENLWSENSTYNYVDHASELFSADALLAIGPKVNVGAEAAGSLNHFPNNDSYDTARARVGPAMRINPTPFLRFRFGGGYERIDYDSESAPALGLRPNDTYYAYGNVEHQINQFFSHSLTLSHDNQLGFNAANLESSTVSYALTWNPRPPLSVSPLVSVSFYDESFGSPTANLYHEKFTYYRFGLDARYNLGPHWQAEAGWAYRIKDSQFDLAGYSQNQVYLELVYRF